MTSLPNGIVIDETSWNSPNYTPAASVTATFGTPRNITGVTIHHWGVDGQSFDNVANFLSRANGNTSAHTVLEDGRVAALIDPSNAAWHAGNAVGNATTIGIECRPESTEGDVETLCQYIAYLEDIYGSLNIYLHKEWHNTACPGRYADKRDYIVQRVNEIHAGAKVSSSPAIDKEASVAAASPKVQPYWTVEKGDTLSKIARYYKGDADTETLQAIADANNMKVSDTLKIGQSVLIPSPLEWHVTEDEEARGITWEEIAEYYGFDADYLRSLNAGKSLTAGTALVVW